MDLNLRRSALALLLCLASPSLAKQPADEAFLYGASTPVTGASKGPQPTYRAIVSSADPRAAAAGVAILRQGGTAADAAIAVMLALTVVEPQSSGIGGGGFMVYQDAKKGLTTFDGREKAPAGATPGYWLGSDGNPLSFPQAVKGGKSVGVPGNLALAAKLHAAHGKLPWSALFQPAIALARGGYRVSGRMHDALESKRAYLADDTMARGIFYEPDGAPKAVGATVRNPLLAATLADLAKRGPDAFYKGAYGKRLVQTVQGAKQNPSPMTEADLAAYRSEERAPVCGTYRKWKVCGMAPPSSGGVGVLAILKQLEPFDLAHLGKDSPTAWHLIGESMRLAYADRAQFIGDPAFVDVPTAGLSSDAYLRGRAALISETATILHAEPGNPPGNPKLAMVPDTEVAGTSDFAVADANGNVASMTSTIESVFGSGLMVDGYMLNNELTDFNFVPSDAHGRPAANRVEGGKRPRSTMSPTIVFDLKGRVVAAVGAAGGPTIMAQVAKALIGVLDWGLPMQEAIALPQLMGIGDGVRIEQGTMLEAMAPKLEALGQSVSAGGLPLKANGIRKVEGGWQGGADPRSEGVVAGLK